MSICLSITITNNIYALKTCAFFVNIPLGVFSWNLLIHSFRLPLNLLTCKTVCLTSTFRVNKYPIHRTFFFNYFIYCYFAENHFYSLSILVAKQSLSIHLKCITILFFFIYERQSNINVSQMIIKPNFY